MRQESTNSPAMTRVIDKGKVNRLAGKVDKAIRAIMDETGVNYHVAYSQLAKSNPELLGDYREAVNRSQTRQTHKYYRE